MLPSRRRREINNSEETAQPRAGTRRLGLDPASARAPGHDQHATHRSSARPPWTVTQDSRPGTDVATLVPARPRPARALNPATGASGLPQNHLLAPTAGVGSSRPPTTRQNANSCKDGVRQGWQLLAWKVLPAGLVRVRPHASRGTRSDQGGRLACAAAALGSDGGCGGRAVSWWRGR